MTTASLGALEGPVVQATARMATTREVISLLAWTTGPSNKNNYGPRAKGDRATMAKGLKTRNLGPRGLGAGLGAWGG